MLAEIIIKYWVQWLCALVAGAIAFIARRYIKLEEDKLKDKQKERMTELKTEIKDEITKEFDEKVHELTEEDNKIHQEIAGVRDEVFKVDQKVNTINSGVLSIQGKSFKQECRDLLREDHVITVDEFEQLQSDHEIYNNLGGKGKGNELFEAVKAKWINHQ